MASGKNPFGADDSAATSASEEYSMRVPLVYSFRDRLADIIFEGYHICCKQINLYL